MSKTVNFVMANMLHIKYFIPIVIAGNRMGIKSKWFLFWPESKAAPHEPSNQHPGDHIDTLEALAKQYKFEFIRCRDDKDIRGLTIFGERRGVNNVHKKMPDVKKVVLTCMLDFTSYNMYHYYEPQVEHVIFINRTLASMYNCMSSKNLYYGTPKYDIRIDSNSVLSRYGIKNDNNALVFVVNDTGCERKNIDINKLCRWLKELGYNVIAKARSASPAPKDMQYDYYFKEESWYPHTSLELMRVSQIAIVCNSSVNKECVMMNLPWINFDVVNNSKPFRFLHREYGFCKELNASVEENVFKETVETLAHRDNAEEFARARRSYFCEPGGVGKKIMELMP